MHSFCGVNGSLLASVNQTTQMTDARRTEMLAMLAAVFGLIPKER